MSHASTPTTAHEVIRVQVGAAIREYPALFAEYGDHLAEGGELRSLHMFMRWAKDAHKAAPEWMTSFIAWVSLDESGLAYRVATRDGKHYTIEGAAPMSSRVELLELFHA